MKNKIITILFCFTFLLGFTQNKSSISIAWKPDIKEIGDDLNIIERPYFEKAFYPTLNSYPYYVVSEFVDGKVIEADITIENKKTIVVDKDYPKLSSIKTREIKKVIKHLENQSLIQFFVPTFESSAFNLIKLTDFEYSISYSQSNNNKRLLTDNFRSSSNSVMSDGDWYKIGVTSSGIQKLSYSFFTQNGISTNNLDPKNIRIFGYSEGMLSEAVDSKTPATLPEIPVHFEGQNDGSFDNSDYLLFFAKSSNVWEWNNTSKSYYHEKHLYSDTVYYWLNVGSEVGKRINNFDESPEPASHFFTTYENHEFYEVDKVNLIKSGRTWLGDYFDVVSGLSKTFPFNHFNKVPGEKVHFMAKFAVRSTTNSGNTITVKNNGSTVHQTGNIGNVNTEYTSNYVVNKTITDSFDISGTSSNLEFTYNQPVTGAVAWLDYIEIKTESYINLGSTPLEFSQPKSVGSGNITQFEVSNATSNTRIWDITSPYETYEINTNYNNSKVVFKAPTDSIKSFIAFNNTGFKEPFYAGKALNQNLQSLTDIDYIIITASEFKNQAEELAEFHIQNSNLSAKVVTLQQVYNEFSNGHADITAVRNFIKYLFDNASSTESRIKYLLLFGDGNYDPKKRISSGTYFIPSYQSENSISPTASYISDDYFGMINDENGISSSSSTVDIGIGRFPARNTTDAIGFVNKVKNYVNTVKMIGYDGLSGNDMKATFSDWKNKVLFIADDGSSSDNYTSAHLTQTETIVNSVLGQDSSFNVKKVYLDAYNKTSTAGGSRYPDVNREIRESMDKGVFFASYIGHGGEGGWADERILDINDINSWTNFDALPVFLTATCEFSRYDDPERVSGGEYVLLNPNGGSIAMITTTRLVYGGISNNIGFSINFFESVLSKLNGSTPTLGDAIRLAKVLSPLGTNFNNRKFALLGDPAVKMAYPKYSIVTKSINDVEIGNHPDTLKALSKIKISGQIELNNQKTNLNGYVYPTVYDKIETSTTLDNNGTGNFIDYQNRKSILYKGVASVTNGEFSYEFIVPKDINYNYGKGRISYYFANDSIDGTGFTENIIVGGSSDEAADDDTAPMIELFMNDSNFIFGGLTDENPSIYALVSDENGINTSGTSLGHDVSAVLDEDYSNPILLNDFYVAALNNYKSGKIIYPLSELSEGNHTLSLKVWDVNNNSGKAYTEFVVANNAKLAINHVYNYPNPFTTHTKFLFEHNKMNEDLYVLVRIYTVSGKLLKTIESNVVSFGNNQPSPMEWDGLDEYGDKIGRGVYVYQLEVKTSNGETARKLEKLVILR
ncbi:MAG: hypothetical protein CMD35_03720 [Flavobacteriales bacterium]|nr:hypothetical protein [Flavobacteriales bacterium]